MLPIKDEDKHTYSDEILIEVVYAIQIARMTDAVLSIKNELKSVAVAVFALSSEARTSTDVSLVNQSQIQLMDRLRAICERMPDYASLRQHIASYSTRLHDDPDFRVTKVPHEALLEYAQRLLAESYTSSARRDEIWKSRIATNEELAKLTARLTSLSKPSFTEQNRIPMEECLKKLIDLQEELMGLERDDMLRLVVDI